MVNYGTPNTSLALSEHSLTCAAVSQERIFDGFDSLPPPLPATLSYGFVQPLELSPMPVVIMTTAHRFEYLPDVVASIGVAAAGT